MLVWVCTACCWFKHKVTAGLRGAPSLLAAAMLDTYPQHDGRHEDSKFKDSVTCQRERAKHWAGVLRSKEP